MLYEFGYVIFLYLISPFVLYCPILSDCVKETIGATMMSIVSGLVDCPILEVILGESSCLYCNG